MFGMFSKISGLLSILKWVLIIAAVLLVIFMLLRAYGKIRKKGKTTMKSIFSKGRKNKNDLNNMDSF